MVISSTSPEIHHTVAVPLGPRSYNIRVVTNDPAGFGPFARGELARTWAGASCRSALIVTDLHIADLGVPATYSGVAVGRRDRSGDHRIARGRINQIARAGIAALR